MPPADSKQHKRDILVHRFADSFKGPAELCNAQLPFTKFALPLPWYTLNIHRFETALSLQTVYSLQTWGYNSGLPIIALYLCLNKWRCVCYLPSIPTAVVLTEFICHSFWDWAISFYTSCRNNLSGDHYLMFGESEKLEDPLGSLCQVHSSINGSKRSNDAYSPSQ